MTGAFASSLASSIPSVVPRARGCRIDDRSHPHRCCPGIRGASLIPGCRSRARTAGGTRRKIAGREASPAKLRHARRAPASSRWSPPAGRCSLRRGSGSPRRGTRGTSTPRPVASVESPRRALTGSWQPAQSRGYWTPLFCCLDARTEADHRIHRSVRVRALLPGGELASHGTRRTTSRRRRGSATRSPGAAMSAREGGRAR